MDHLINAKKSKLIKLSTMISSKYWSSGYNAALFSILGGIVVAEGRGEDKLEERLGNHVPLPRLKAEAAEAQNIQNMVYPGPDCQ